MSSAPVEGLNEHRIEAQGERFDGVLDEPVRRALERSQVLDAGAVPQEAGNLLQAAMRLKNMSRLREQEEARLRELEARVRAEALATIKLRKQAAELAGVEARAKNIARVRAETVARLAELEQQIRDDALATVALRQEIARRQAEAQSAPSSAALPQAAEMPVPPLQPEPAPLAATDGSPAIAPASRRTGLAYLAWSGWGMAMLLLGVWWGSRGMMPAPVPPSPPAAAPVAGKPAVPAVAPGGEPAFALKLETELHTLPH